MNIKAEKILAKIDWEKDYEKGKKEKKESFCVLGLAFFEGDTEKVQKRIADIPKFIQEAYPNRPPESLVFDRYEIDIDRDWDSTTVIVWGCRLETLEEYKIRRIKLIENSISKKTAAEKKEQEERKLYEKLKKKFEKQKSH